LSPLPYLSRGQLLDQGNVQVLPSVPCSIWPVSHRTEDRGRFHDHEGEAPILYASALTVENRTLVVDGVRYKIVDATVHQLVPHVSMTLRALDG
jgi:hypothetical protein